MDFLKGKFDEEISVHIEDNGDVNIAGNFFKPDIILKEMDSTGYDEAFIKWLDQREENLLAPVSIWGTKNQAKKSSNTNAVISTPKISSMRVCARSFLA